MDYRNIVMNIRGFTLHLFDSRTTCSINNLRYQNNIFFIKDHERSPDPGSTGQKDQLEPGPRKDKKSQVIFKLELTQTRTKKPEFGPELEEV